MAYIPQSKEEEEYLKAYDPNHWAKPAVTTDIAVFGYSKRKLYLLLVERGNYPFKGCLALPGGFANMDEDLIETARRELEEETGLQGMFLEQVSMWGKPGRDPRDRTVTALYLALIDKDKAKVAAGDDAQAAEWFEITNFIENRDYFEINKVMRTKKLILQSETVLAPLIRETICYEETKSIQTEILDDSEIAFDHAHCIIDAYEKLRERLLCSDLAYELLGRKFELSEMKKLYDVVFMRNWNIEELAKLKMVEKKEDGRYSWIMC